MTHSLQGQRPLVWTLTLLNTVAYGALYYAQPLLAVQFEHDLGWTRSQTALAFTLALLVTAFSAPAMGRRLDNQGGRFLLTAGSGLGALAFVVMAFSATLPLFTLGWLLAGVAMGLTFYEATFAVLGQQVRGAARTQATLTITLVAGLASTIFVPLTTWLLPQGGRQGTLLSLAALLLFCALGTWFVVPAKPAGHRQHLPQTFQPDAAFWPLTVAFTLGRVVTVGVGLQLAPMLLWKGYSPALAAALTGLMGLAALPGRVAFVPLLGRFGASSVTTVLLLLLGGSTFLLNTSALGWLALAVVLFGLANGALTLARAELIASRYAPEIFGTVNGRLSWFVNLAQAVTPFAVGVLYSLSGGYRLSLLLMLLLSLVAAWGLRQPLHPA